MMQNKKILTISFLTLCFFSSFSWAQFLFDETLEQRHMAVKGAIGAGWLSGHEASLHVTQYETDEITFQNPASGVVGSLGIAYVIPTNARFWEKWRWLSTVKLSLDLTQQFETTLDGDVFLYGDHNFDSYGSETRIESTNLIVNASLDVVRYENMYLFVMGGVGLARTDVTYHEMPDPDVFRGNLTLDRNTTYTAAFQGGAGLGYALTPDINATVTYLYTDLGDVRTADTGNTDDIPNPALQSARFNLRQQSVLFGLEYAF